MGSKSAIEWTDATWSPIRARRRSDGKLGWHCEIVSPGCGNCYASSINKRLGTGSHYTSRGNPEVELFLDENMLTAPLRWRKPRRVFVCSMTDLFADFVPDEWIDRVFAVMALAEEHTFQVLTKRSDRMRTYFSAQDRSFSVEMVGWGGPGFEGYSRPVQLPSWPLPNVWLGVSAEDQPRLDERVPELLATPGAVRFVSAEPLLGPLDFLGAMERATASPNQPAAPAPFWVIVGGESGPGARPMDVAWVRSIVGQCREAGVACFVKQLGARPMFHWTEGASPIGLSLGANEDGQLYPVRLTHSKGGNPDEWPEDLRVREFPEVRA